MLVVFVDLQDLDESGKLNYIIKLVISNQVNTTVSLDSHKNQPQKTLV